ncbi:MAG: glutaminase A [Planctomycetota bacterium]
MNATPSGAVRAGALLLVPALLLLFQGGAATLERKAPAGLADIEAAVAKAYEAHKDDQGGKNADYIPYLAEVPSELFAVVVVTVDGKVVAKGDADYGFSIQSVSKPFTAALVMQESGADTIRTKIGVEPTGQPFNSVLAIETLEARSVNPMVNAGAMAAVSLVKAEGVQQRYTRIFDWYGRFAGEPLELNEEVCRSEMATNQRNQGIAALLKAYGRLYADIDETVTVYTQQCSINVTARQLAVMGATLANGGVNPVTKQRVLDGKLVPKLLAVMMMAGFYDEAGEWAWTAGVPAKTGVGGGIVAVVPGRMAIVGFSPRLNQAGNSVRAAKAIGTIVEELGLNLFGRGR